ncbi:FUSC family protein [Bradyrhizobium sp. CB1650]|uniref:FUSC family protein n=1 Tax=Bradyrhizobium sp. CB1650 TaxID=3039153 RepID=UPI002434F1A2|nr:FUSC family protein [Bradyrhizobium sp. CB1650]WGD53159.1 FUSC family protein [Bradyrhizobium sp. CB1650]
MAIYPAFRGGPNVLATTAGQPFTVVKIPIASWSFAIRIWLATVLALFVSFWLQLESPTTAALTIGVLAEPTRGQALDKAAFRLLATVVGVVASIAITGFFSQTRDLVLAAFAVWLGICVFTAKLLDGYRAYAAVLSGYTVALIATQQIDNPQRVFELGMARGAAITVGILSMAVVNSLLFAPDRQPRLLAQLTALHRRVREYAGASLRGEASNPTTFLTLLREIVALRSEIASVALESSGGWVRSAAARSAAVALVTELRAARTGSDPGSEASAWVVKELLRRDDEVRQDLSALRSARWPLRSWRAPLYRSWRLAVESGVRATAWFAIASMFYIWAGWPAASTSLSFVALIAALGATTPKPRAFTVLAIVAAPITAVLTGMLEFVILDGADAFPLLAIGLGPLVIGSALLMTSENPLWSGLGRAVLSFSMLMLTPSNPQTYNPQAFLFSSLFIIAGAALLLVTQTLIPPISDEKRRMRLVAEARSELQDAAHASGEAPEEAMFRAASRLEQFLAAGGAQHNRALAEMLSCFDRSAIVQLCESDVVDLRSESSREAT